MKKLLLFAIIAVSFAFSQNHAYALSPASMSSVNISTSINTQAALNAENAVRNTEESQSDDTNDKNSNDGLGKSVRIVLGVICVLVMVAAMFCAIF